MGELFMLVHKDAKVEIKDSEIIVSAVDEAS